MACQEKLTLHTVQYFTNITLVVNLDFYLLAIKLVSMRKCKSFTLNQVTNYCCVYTLIIAANLSTNAKDTQKLNTTCNVVLPLYTNTPYI